MPCVRHQQCDGADGFMLAEQHGGHQHPFEGVNVRAQYAPDLLVEPMHIHARLRVDIGGRRVHATVTHTVRCRATHKPEESAVGVSDGDNDVLRPAVTVRLNGVGFAGVQAGDGVSDLAYDGEVMTVSLSTADGTASNQCDTLRHFTVQYDVVEPTSGLFFSTDRANGGYYAITDHETERARYWLACVDFPSVRTTLTFDISAPRELTALANGRLTGQVDSEEVGFTTSTWHLDHPCPSYLICWAVGEFVAVDDGEVDGIPVKYFAPKHFKADDVRRSFDKTPAMIRWLQTKLDSKFPWPKYFQIAAPHIRGAMENISLVTWSHRFLMDETWALERKHAMDTVNIHEMAHTYFGDLIVIRHFEHVWMKESWATYIESVWIQDHLTEDDFRYEMYENAVSYVRETERYMRPLVTRKYESSWSLFDSHTYPGGCWRIHMLRCLLGEVIFWRAVRKYVATYRGKVVETEDFRKVLEHESGMNLTRFFDEWFYSKGFPALKVSHTYNNEAGECSVTVEQTQVSPADKKDIPLFHMQVDVEIVDEAGAVTVTRADFTDDCPRVTVKIKCAAKPEIIRIDPDGKLMVTVDFNPGEPMLTAIAASAGDVVSRIRAYQELVKIGTHAAMKSVSDLVQKEPYYGVRSRVADALKEKASQRAVSVLAQMLDQETHPLAMWNVANNCRLRDAGIRQALLRFLKRPNLPYRANAEALQSLGYQAVAEDESLLLETAKSTTMCGMHNIVRAGALRALGHLHTPSAYKYLVTRVESKVESVLGAMPAALEALANASRWQDEPARRLHAISLLEEWAVRSDDEPCRRAAIGGLQMLDAKRSADAVWESRSLYAAQDWPWLEGKVNALRGRDGPNNKDLLKRLEDAEGKLRKLEDKLLESKLAGGTEGPKTEPASST